MRRTSAARVMEELEPRGQDRGPALRLLPPPPLRPVTPGVMRHPEEIMSENRVVLADLLDVLAAGGIKYALVGGLLSSIYGKDRATVDVDMLIPRRAMGKLATTLAARGYRIESNEDMLRAYRGKIAVADLVVREANPVLRAASATAKPTELLGLMVDVVSRGAFVALKFNAAISPTRRIRDKYQDVADIASVLERRFSAQDERLALKIAAQCYNGAERELAAIIDDLRHERPVKI